MGDNPYGPFTYKGEILDTMNGVTNYHSIVEYKGNWYLFYHNANKFFHDNPTAKPDDANRWFRRSACVDYLHYNADGTIQKVIPIKESVKKLNNYRFPMKRKY